MKVVFTDEAMRDLNHIYLFLWQNYPGISRPFESRLQTIITRIGNWPESAQEVIDHPGVRGVPFIRFPYRLFYRVNAERIEVLHVHHSARDLPEE